MARVWLIFGYGVFSSVSMCMEALCKVPADLRGNLAMLCYPRTICFNNEERVTMREWLGYEKRGMSMMDPLRG